MRVKVSYGMDIQDIPQRVQDLGLVTLQTLKETVATLEKALANIDDSENDYVFVLSQFEKVRLELTNSDLVIADLISLLEGLHNYYIGENNVSERRPTMDPRGDATTQTEDGGEG
jgi:hypothetical protein